MTRPRTVSRWTRLLLLAAAFLQIAGSAAGPWVHAQVVARAAAEQTSQGPRKAPLPPHDERDCAVCQAFSAVPLPAEPPLLPFIATAAQPSLLTAGILHAEVAPATANARAPPAVPA